MKAAAPRLMQLNSTARPPNTALQIKMRYACVACASVLDPGDPHNYLINVPGAGFEQAAWSFVEMKGFNTQRNRALAGRTQPQGLVLLHDRHPEAVVIGQNLLPARRRLDVGSMLLVPIGPVTKRQDPPGRRRAATAAPRGASYLRLRLPPHPALLGLHDHQ